jgi:hypothetical protein
MAGYFLEEAMRNWVAVKDWKYLITDVSIAITSASSVYDLPTDFRKMYDVRLQTNSRTLKYIDASDYDNQHPQASTPSVPTGYMLQHQWEVASTGGKIELVPGCSVSDNLLISYYRKVTIPSAILTGATSSDSTTIDIPEHYHSFLLAWARALYLANKGGEDQRMMFWTKIAQDGLLKARAADEWNPDDSPGFQPGASQAQYNPNNTLPWADYY